MDLGQCFLEIERREGGFHPEEHIGGVGWGGACSIIRLGPVFVEYILHVENATSSNVPIGLHALPLREIWFDLTGRTAY